MSDEERYRRQLGALMLEYLANGARDEDQARIWMLRGMDISWAMISQTLNTQGSRHPKDGKIWSPSRARTYFGEPPSRKPTRGV